MKKEFIPYEQALDLKELGFDEPCFGIYNIGNNHYPDGTFHISRPHPFTEDEVSISHQDKKEVIVYITAPLYQQAFKWFRKKHKINSQIAFCEYGIKSENSWKFTFDNPTGRQYWEGEFKTYEEAELACLKKLIQIIKNN